MHISTQHARADQQQLATPCKSFPIISQILVGSNFYEGESYVVVEDVVGDVFSFLFVNSKDSRVVEVEAYILRRTSTGRTNRDSWGFSNVLFG